MLQEQGIPLVIEDQRNEGEPLDLRFRGELTTIQKRAAEAILEHDIGVLVAPPGVGKSVLDTYLVSQRGRNTLILVHRRPLLDQWVTQPLGGQGRTIEEIARARSPGRGSVRRLPTDRGMIRATLG